MENFVITLLKIAWTNQVCSGNPKNWIFWMLKFYYSDYQVVKSHLGGRAIGQNKPGIHIIYANPSTFLYLKLYKYLRFK